MVLASRLPGGSCWDLAFGATPTWLAGDGWTPPGSRTLRVLGGLLTTAALAELALGDWPLAGALTLVLGMTAWLTCSTATSAT